MKALEIKGFLAYRNGFDSRTLLHFRKLRKHYVFGAFPLFPMVCWLLCVCRIWTFWNAHKQK
nr:MAG TPA: hypothetical protein [Caudoviricetes sp.]